ncbi:MAG: hypothetical protein PF542_06075 [Nanoarchaeota archaeon]|jgi:uncharacterized protein|nr:hypothetical protein [Nanoarchaeota archaeon]
MRRLEYKQQLVDYFVRNLTSSKRYDADTLKFALYNQGYSRVAVSQAYDSAVKQLAEKAPPIEKPVIRHEVYDMQDNPIHIEPMTRWEKFKHKLKGNKI